MRLYIGTYSEPVLFGTGEVFRGHGEGLYACDFDGGSLQIRHILKLGNPSFFALRPEKGKIYAVNEMKEFQGAYGGGVTEISLQPDGFMKAEASCPAGGTDPCHAALSPDGALLSVANYADGSVTFFPLDPAGRISVSGTRFQHTGKGPDAARQQGPHTHSVLFDGRGHAWAVDLGADTLFGYDIRSGSAVPDDSITLRVAPGSGPRAGVFSGKGDRLYLMHEIACAVSCWEVPESGILRELRTVSLLPGEKADGVTGAALQLSPDGKYLYASVRGLNTLSVLALDPDGIPRPVQSVSVCGKTPRHFAVSPDGGFLLAGNQDSDSISVFRRMPDGTLQFSRTLPFPTPVCLRFAP